MEHTEKKCWKCAATLADFPGGKVPFRAICDACSAYLHCCRNCRNYAPGKPNDCAIPGTDFIADREAANFCESFALLGKAPLPKVAPDDIAKKLFKD